MPLSQGHPSGPPSQPNSLFQPSALPTVFDGPLLKDKDPGTAESCICHLPPSLMHHTPLRNEGLGFLEIEWNKISCHLPEDSAAHMFSHTRCYEGTIPMLWAVLGLFLWEQIRFKLQLLSTSVLQRQALTPAIFIRGSGLFCITANPAGDQDTGLSPVILQVYLLFSLAGTG